jgi:hypothetical protein
MIYVNDAGQHKMRFGSRCEGGSIDPEINRYVKNFRYIRAIQKSIIQNPYDSKYIKVDNDDAKKTLGLVTTLIRKYLKKLMKLSYIQLKSLAANRKRNILGDCFSKARHEVENIMENSKSVNIDKKSLRFSKEPANFKLLYKNSYRDSRRYWFLRHEKLFHLRTKKDPLTIPFNTRRFKSLKKVKLQELEGVEIEEVKMYKNKLKVYNKQKSIFDAIRKYGKKTLASKISESTACTITIIKAID